MSFALPLFKNWREKERYGPPASPDESEEIGPEEREKIMNNAGFMKHLDGFLAERQKRGEKPHVILITYNRVGKGEEEEKAYGEKYVLDTWSGAPDIPLDDKGAEKFIRDTETRLDTEMPYLVKNKPLMVFYAGEAEKFNKTAAMIDRLDATFEAYGIAPEKKPEIFLLTCACCKEEKIKEVIPLLKAGRLQGLIRGDEKNKDCGCGGMNDLADIAKHLEVKYAPEKKVRKITDHVRQISANDEDDGAARPGQRERRVLH